MGQHGQHRALVMRLALALLAWLALAAQPAAQECRLALALAVDVSGSIDPGEYRFQMDGLADALEAPEIADALVQAQAAVMVFQWSGARDQDVTIPWRRMNGHDAVAQLAAQIRAAPRRWHGGKTAIGDALAYVVPRFAEVADCPRRVIDVSGDGMANDGIEPRPQRVAAQSLDITINGLAIDRIGRSVTQYYRNHVTIGQDSFVETATGYSDYPRAIRRKLYREVAAPGV